MLVRSNPYASAMKATMHGAEVDGNMFMEMWFGCWNGLAVVGAIGDICIT